MAGQREDYILRLIDELRQFVAQLIRLRSTDRLDEALVAAVGAQERLFARPARDFMPLPVADQLRLLTLGESPDTGRAKCLAYAEILEQAGLVYRAKSQEAFAASAFELSLCVLAHAALASPAAAAEARPAIGRLLAQHPADRLHAPVRELLERAAGE
jgi:hypothetical protein